MTRLQTALIRATALLLAPALLLAGGLYHPWIGSPGDPGFLSRLAGAVSANPDRWVIAHLLVAVGSAFLVLAFLVIRSYLRESRNDNWSMVGLPFIVIGSTLYALLPAMEFAPWAAAASGGDAGAVQAALLPWFRPILLIGALTFAVGALGFAVGIARAGVLSPLSTWVVVSALLIMAASRFVPVGVARLYVGPAAGLVALGRIAFLVGRPPEGVTSTESSLRKTARA